MSRDVDACSTHHRPCSMEFTHTYVYMIDSLYACTVDLVILKIYFNRSVKFRVAHASGMPGTFFPPPTSKETASQWSRLASRHVCHSCAVIHVGIANPRWRGKLSRHSRHYRRMRNSQFYVSRKMLIILYVKHGYMSEWKPYHGHRIPKVSFYKRIPQ